MKIITKTALLVSALGGAVIFAQYNNVMAEKDLSQQEADMNQKDAQFKDVPLTELQKYVTQHDGTEPPFQNAYWDNHEPGIYVDVVSGEPLFSSTDKFDSGTGWPSFTKPLRDQALVSKVDNKLFMQRTEVRSSTADSHLGHVFDDGPADKGGLRYCINSAALRFVHKDDLEKEGYEEFLYLFEDLKE